MRRRLRAPVVTADHDRTGLLRKASVRNLVCLGSRSTSTALPAAGCTQPEGCFGIVPRCGPRSPIWWVDRAGAAKLTRDNINPVVLRK